MKRYLSFFISLIIVIQLQAGSFDRVAISPRAIGMSGAFTGLADDVFGIYYNPAGLVQLPKDEIGFAYQNLYGLSLVNYYFLGYAKPGIGKGAIGIGWLHMGLGEEFVIKNFSENTVFLSYGYKLMDSFNLGLSIKFFGASYSGLRGLSWGSDISFLYHYDNKVYAGLIIQDINNPTIKWENKATDNISRNVNIGLMSPFMEWIVLTGEIKNFFDNYLRLYGMGTELKFLEDKLKLRGGVALTKNLFSFSFGAGIALSSVNFDYSVQKHSDLDYNHIAGVIIKI